MAQKISDIVKKNYKKNPILEWKRLQKSCYHELEFKTSMRFIKKYIKKNSFVLDAGGGPGRYTIELAKLGNEIILFDLVSEHLEIAKKKIKKMKLEKKVKGYIEGTITDLSQFENNTFDVILCLGGPLSHIYPESERNKTVDELIRVAKKGAFIFISVMSKYGTLLATPFRWPDEVKYKKHFEDVAFKGEDNRWKKNGYCHYFTSLELSNLFKKKNVKIVEKLGLKGLNLTPETTNNFVKKHPKAWKNWEKINEKLCTESVVVDLSSHMMIIVQKK